MPHRLNAENDQQEFVDNGVRFVRLVHQGEAWRLGATTPNWRTALTTMPHKPDAEALRALNAQGVWLAQERDAQKRPRVAVACCGQGSVWMGMGRELYDTFPAVREAMDRIAAAAHWDILSLMDETDTERIFNTRWQQPYIFLLEYAQAHYLESLGFVPQVMSGHSLGELVALCLARVYTPEQAFEIVDRHAVVLEDLRRNYSHDTGMMAVYNFHENIETVLETFPGLSVSNYNSPTQYILSGSKDVLVEARRALRKKKVPAITLNVDMAFHHKNIHIIRDTVITGLLEIPSQPPYIPMLSNATGALYPHEHEAICTYMADLDESAVRWVDCVRYMWEKEHVRHFVELGPANTISGLIQEIQPDALCIATSAKNKEVEAMRMAVAQLYSLGHICAQGVHTVPHDIDGESLISDASEACTEQVVDSAPEQQYVLDILPILSETTGFAVQELRAHMDLRYDLSIRSSRFPSMMHQLEKKFNIQLQFEDFIEVSTIGDLARVVANLRNKDSGAFIENLLDDAREVDRIEAAPPYAQAVFRARPLPFALPIPPMPADMAAGVGKDVLPALIVGKTAHARLWHDILLPMGGEERVRYVEDTHNALMLLQQGFHPALLVFTSTSADLASSVTAPTTTAMSANTDEKVQQELSEDAHMEQAVHLLQAFAQSPRAYFCIAHHAPPTAHAPMQVSFLPHTQSPLFGTVAALLMTLPTINAKVVTHDSSISADVLKACVRRLLLGAPATLPFYIHVGRAHMHSVRLVPCAWNEPLMRRYDRGLFRHKDRVLIYAQDATYLNAFLTLCAPLECDIIVLCAEGCALSDNADGVVYKKCLAHTVHLQDESFLQATLQDIVASWSGVDALVLLYSDAQHISDAHLAPKGILAVFKTVRQIFAALGHVRSVINLSHVSCENHINTAWASIQSLACEYGAEGHEQFWRNIHIPQSVASSGSAACLHEDTVAFALAHECFGNAHGTSYWLTGDVSLPHSVHAMPLLSAGSEGQALWEYPRMFPSIFPKKLTLAPAPRLESLCHFSPSADMLVRWNGGVTPASLLERLTQGIRMLYPWLELHTLEEVRFTQMSADIPCPQGIIREGRMWIQAKGRQADALVFLAGLDMRHMTANGRRTDVWEEAVTALVTLREKCHAIASTDEASFPHSTKTQHSGKICMPICIAENVHLRYTPSWICFQLFIEKVLKQGAHLQACEKIVFMPAAIQLEILGPHEELVATWEEVQEHDVCIVDGSLSASDGSLLLTAQGMV